MTLQMETDEWKLKALALADWTIERLVNRTDVYGRYRKDGSAVTAPPKGARGRKFLTREHLADHYRGDPGHLVGLHTTSPENTSKWGAIDIDRKGDDGPSAKATEAAAISYGEELEAAGYQVLLTTSNGIGGFHVHALFADPRPTEEVHALLQSVVINFAELGLPSEPETFPKQPRIPPGGFGNWLRLPGRHPKRDHWSQVWSGDCWLKGCEAIDFVLGLGGASPRTLKQTHCMCPSRSATGAEESRCAHFAQNEIPPTVEDAIAATLPVGPGRRNRCVFHLARRLKALLPEATADELRPIVSEWHRRALPVIRTKAFTETWADFVIAWGRVQVPFGSSLAPIVEMARMMPPPAAALKYDEEHVRLLVAICVSLQQFHGTGPFFLSCRKAGEVIGVSKSDASRLLRMLVFDSVLEVVNAGSYGTNTATEYRCLVS
jgi:hypothetical protein